MSEPLEVVLRGAIKRFGTRVVLDGIDLAIEGGQTVALIGPSGAGKSTLLRSINGLVRLDEGEIRVGPHVLRPLGSAAMDRRFRDDCSSDDPSKCLSENLDPATCGRTKSGDPSPHPKAPFVRRLGRRLLPFLHKDQAVWAVRRSLGMIFQDFQLFSHLTALENIMEAPVRVLGIPRAEAGKRGMDLLKRVGLADRHDAYPQELSGGQKQRIAIARAMAIEPRGLLCDEITSALDPELKGEVLAVLEDLKRDGLTLILVTHEIAFARRAADRIVVLADGRILEDGSPQDVLDHPQNPRTQKFLSQVMGAR